MGFFKTLRQEIKIYKANRNYKSKIEYLREKGAVIGDNTKLNCGVAAFGTEPYLITVGDKCLFAAGLRIFTHDGGVTVLNQLGYFDGERMDKIAPVKIGDNVYIGTGAMIMPGVTIGSNVIIGAGAIVSRDIPDNCVAVGVPAKPIKTIEEYYKSAKEKDLFYPTVGMNAADKRAYYEKIFKKSEDNGD